MDKLNRFIVIFTPTNARVVKNPTDEEYDFISAWPNAIIDPDMSRVDGVPPHFWKLDRGYVVPMNDAERNYRLDQIKKYGVDNRLEPYYVKFRKKYVSDRGVDLFFYILILAVLIFDLLEGKKWLQKLLERVF